MNRKTFRATIPAGKTWQPETDSEHVSFPFSWVHVEHRDTPDGMVGNALVGIGGNPGSAIADPTAYDRRIQPGKARTWNCCGEHGSMASNLWVQNDGLAAIHVVIDVADAPIVDIVEESDAAPFPYAVTDQAQPTVSSVTAAGDTDIGAVFVKTAKTRFMRDAWLTVSCTAAVAAGTVKLYLKGITSGTTLQVIQVPLVAGIAVQAQTVHPDFDGTPWDIWDLFPNDSEVNLHVVNIAACSLGYGLISA